MSKSNVLKISDYKQLDIASSKKLEIVSSKQLKKPILEFKKLDEFGYKMPISQSLNQFIVMLMCLFISTGIIYFFLSSHSCMPCTK